MSDFNLIISCIGFIIQPHQKTETQTNGKVKLILSKQH